jgi:ATP-dependent Lhr-like helicase
MEKSKVPSLVSWGQPSFFCELVIGEAGEKNFLSSNWGPLFAVFDSAPMYEVMEGKKQVGTLDSAFVESVPVPFLFVLGGIEWEAVRIDTKNKQVIVQRTRIGDAPSWSVFRMSDVPIETAKEAGSILFEKDYPDFYDDEAKTGIDAVRNKCVGIGWRNGQWVITASASGKAEERRRLKIWQRQQGRQNDWESKRPIANKSPGTISISLISTKKPK